LRDIHRSGIFSAMITKRGAAAFDLRSPNEKMDYDELINRKGVIVLKTVDGLTKEGEAVRVVDYVEVEREPYKPPIC